jgi:Family of unknown function (DUF6328)
MALKDKVKTALDETRLLILGSQILFGFQFNGMFQDGFDTPSDLSRGLDAAAFFLMALAVGCLITPSMQHQLVERGNDSVRLLDAATGYAGLALVPFSVSLGIDFLVVLERHVPFRLALLLAAIFFGLAILSWFALPLLLAIWEKPMRTS